MKIISVLLMSIMVLLLAGCGKDRLNDNTVDDGQNDMSDYSADINDYNDFSEQVQPSSNMDKMLSANLQYPSSNAEWEYNVYDCYVEITDCNVDFTETLVIPDEIESLPVWKYSDSYGGEDPTTVDKVKNIVLPKNLLVIGVRAFGSYDNLKTITLPNNLVALEEGAFSGCCCLEKITLPETLETIGEHSFYYCCSLKSIELPKSVKKIESEAFEYTNAEFEYDTNLYVSASDVSGIELTVNNPEMEFSKDIGDVSLIRGYAGSTAAKYAAEKNIKFEVID